MNFALFSLGLLFLLSSALSLTDEEWKKDYFRKLENSYDKSIPPEGEDGPGSGVKVAVSTYILDIHEVDDYNMDFKAHFYFRQIWNDSRLSYKRDVGPLIMRDVDNIWTPDLFFTEEREGSLHEVTHPNKFCRIKPNGEVLFSSKFGVKFSCPMDLRNYPHDTQICKISIESYGFQRQQLELEWFKGHHEPLMFAENITMLEFDLIDAIPTTKHIMLYKTGNYSNLQINLTLKRKFGFFANRLYVPFVILVLMTSVTLWIRATEKFLRLALLLVILYLMVNIATSVNRLTPSASYTKAIDVWIGFCQSLVFAAFLEYVAVALLASKESEAGDSETSCKNLLDVDTESAKESKLNMSLSKVVKDYLDAKGGNTSPLSLRIDKISRILFPLIFIIFNIVYWSVYCCS